MTAKKQEDVEAIQKVVARSIATHPVGRNLALIGGFRYRFLDGSVRTSDDIDYHWAGDLEEKQEELIIFFSRVLFPEIYRRFGYSGKAGARSGPDADSPVVRVVDLSFWKDNVPYSRMEIPVEVTRIACADPIEVRTAGGTVYATASEGDMIESKVIAVFNRTILEHRDIVDVFLFQDRFLSDSGRRLKTKLDTMKLTLSDIEERMLDLQEHRDYHAKAVQEVIDTQLNHEAGAQLNDAGGGQMVLDMAMNVLNRYIKVWRSDESN